MLIWEQLPYTDFTEITNDFAIENCIIYINKFFRRLHKLLMLIWKQLPYTDFTEITSDFAIENYHIHHLPLSPTPSTNN
jgi:hypothetical protein